MRQAIKGAYSWVSSVTGIERQVRWELDPRPNEGICSLADRREIGASGTLRTMGTTVMSWEAACAFADAVNAVRERYEADEADMAQIAREWSEYDRDPPGS